MPRYRIGVDVGGTFTDFLLIDEEGNAVIYKTPSTPKDPSLGFMNGLGEMASARGVSLEEFLRQVDIIVHGTTVTTNAVLTLTGAKTGLLTTKGVRDVVEMRRGQREKFYDNKYTAPSPLVPRYLRRPVEERMDLEGKAVASLNEEDVRRAIRLFKEEGVEAVAVCYMHSYANPEHERKTREILEREFPEAYVTISYDILPQIRLYERVSTTAFNSYTGPLLKSYLDRLMKNLADLKSEVTLLIMQSNGGVMFPEVAIRHPAATLVSGPAGGPVAGLVYAGVQGLDDFITIDLGGTSFDACLIKERTPVITLEGKIDRRALALPMVEIHSIGAGGGTVAWIDAGGMFRMGPMSMGADPGPACYDIGGEEATSTDVDLILGYVNPDYFLGGKLKLNYDKAYKALKEKVADKAKMDVIAAAAGMYDVINTNMASGVREITVKKGWDPREFPLIVAGGAGPVHACSIALELEIPVAIVPKESSVFCATGMLISDLRHDFVRTYRLPFAAVDKDRFNSLFKEMEDEGTRMLEVEKVPKDRRRFDYALDVRYIGEYYEIATPITAEEREGMLLDSISDNFHALHDKLYGYQLKEEGVPLELINLRVTAWGVTPKPKFKEEPYQGIDSSHAIKGRRKIYLTRQKEWVDASIYNGAKLGFGNKVEGPAIIELPTTTIVVLPEFNLLCDRFGSYTLYLPEKEGEVKKRIGIG